MVLDVKDLSKVYRSGDRDLKALDSVSFSLGAGATLSILGPSGSGKTTLLGLCAGLDHPSSGEVSINGVPLSQLNEDERAAVRNKSVGFVFQNFQLLPNLTCLENAVIPLELRGERGGEGRAKELLDRVGLSKRLHHYPSQLSGGEQQRVAVARAFVNNPKLVFADEPTGNLDEATSELVVDLIFEMNKEYGTALALVTHDLELAELTQSVIRLRNGRLDQGE